MSNIGMLYELFYKIRHHIKGSGIDLTLPHCVPLN